MNVETVLHGIRFAWDSEKAATNRAKHGVSFEIACEAFFDPFVRVVEANGTDEVREVLIGMTMAGRLLFVVHAERGEDVFRVISARHATAAERRLYEDS